MLILNKLLLYAVGLSLGQSTLFESKNNIKFQSHTEMI